MTKPMPKAGRPKRVPGKQVPPRVPGVTGGKMRSRTDADAPSSPTGKAGKPQAAKPKTKRKAS